MRGPMAVLCITILFRGVFSTRGAIAFATLRPRGVQQEYNSRGGGGQAADGLKAQLAAERRAQAAVRTLRSCDAPSRAPPSPACCAL